MRRLLPFLLLVVLVSATATGIHASTDCERWFLAYKQELAHAKAVQRIEAAKRRARLYAKRKMAGYVAPKPKPPVAPHPHPHKSPMSREEILRHFTLACGVLPEESQDVTQVSEETPEDFQPERPLDEQLGLIPQPDGELIAMDDGPPPMGYSMDGGSPTGGPPIYYPGFGGVPGGGGGGGTPPPGSSAPGTPPGGGTPTGGGGTPPPGGGGTPPPGGGGTPPPDNGGPPLGPPPPGGGAPPPDNGGPPLGPPPPGGGTTPVVPEPSSYVLMLTGLAGAVGVVRNRLGR
jgi:hypothetical protein